MSEPSPIRLSIERPAPDIVARFAKLAPTALADFLPLESVMRLAIRPLWPDIPRIAGPAFTVRTPRHDNLMLHAAIYRAEPGDVIVVEAGGEAIAGGRGHACALPPQRRGARVAAGRGGRDTRVSRPHRRSRLL